VLGKHYPERNLSPRENFSSTSPNTTAFDDGKKLLDGFFD